MNLKYPPIRRSRVPRLWIRVGGNLWNLRVERREIFEGDFILRIVIFMN